MVDLEKLKSHHLEDLQRSGLNVETLEAAGIRSASGEEARKKLRRREKVSPGIEFPYTAHNGVPGYSRFKLDDPPVGKNGRPCKYLSPIGAVNRFYIAPTLPKEVLSDISQDLLMTEGEKKALKTIQEGFPSIGLAGVWCWRTGDKKAGKSSPISDFDQVKWEGRRVYIVFDSDIVENHSVQRAEWELAQELQRRGAIVNVVRLPGGSDGGKVGLDDFLVAHGDRGSEELGKLLLAALEPQEPDTELLDDPLFIEPALAFVDDLAMVARMTRGRRLLEAKEEDIQYDVWMPQIITSKREIIQIPSRRTKDPGEIIHLRDSYYLRRVLEEASARWSIASLRSFLSGAAQAPDIAALYRDILAAFKGWCYFPDEPTYHVISLHVFGSYFFELFSAYPYINLNGPPNSGKTTTGKLAAALAFNGMLLIDPSNASLFRIIEREKPYLVIDEKENAATRRDAAEEPGLMALLKSGYQKGGRVSRQNARNVDRTEYYSVYSPKLICNVHGLEDILQDRSISIITRQAPTNSSIRGHQPDMEDMRWQGIRDRLYLALMFCHEEVKQHRDADLSGDLARLREKELFKPLVDLALWVDAHSGGDTATTAIMGALETQRDARSFNRSLTPEVQLVSALRELVGDEAEAEVHTGEIKAAIADQSTDPPDWCHERWIGATLRKLNIWQSKRDDRRKRATIYGKDGMPEQKMLTHYRIKAERLPEQ